MLIREILTESYDDDLIAVVRDLIDPEQIIQAVDKSGYASSVDDSEIVPKDQLSKDVSTDDEPSVDVGKMAGDQALSDIKAEL